MNESPVLAFVECAGCGESFPVRSRLALNRAKWCSERCRKAQYAGACVDCGSPTNGSDGRGPNAAKRCAKCRDARTVTLNQERGRQHRELVERLWAEGLTCQQIGERLGWASAPSAHISMLRSSGYHLPYRRTPEQVARIAAAAGFQPGRPDLKRVAA